MFNTRKYHVEFRSGAVLKWIQWKTAPIVLKEVNSVKYVNPKLIV